MASGFTVATNEHLIRSNLWSRQLKQLLLDDLMATRFVRTLTDFPDGTTLNIPSIGEAETADFAEGQAIKYNKMDTGNFVFSFDQYKYSANSISAKFKRDSYYASDVIAAFIPRQHRALMEAVETRILSRASAGQTANNPNTINGADHRWVGTGSGTFPGTAGIAGTQTLALRDFAKALYSLTKAQVPLTNLTAIVDPAVAYALQSSASVTSYLSPMPMWENVIQNGLVTGMRFRFNLYGFDVYTSNYLANPGIETITPSAVGAVAWTVGTATISSVANLFFSAATGDTCPLIGGFRQMPTVFSEFNKDLQQEEYVTIAEYGYKLYRPENMVVVLTDQAII